MTAVAMGIMAAMAFAVAAWCAQGAEALDHDIGTYGRMRGTTRMTVLLWGGLLLSGGFGAVLAWGALRAVWAAVKQRRE